MRGMSVLCPNNRTMSDFYLFGITWIVKLTVTKWFVKSFLKQIYKVIIVNIYSCCFVLVWDFVLHPKCVE